MKKRRIQILLLGVISLSILGLSTYQSNQITTMKKEVYQDNRESFTRVHMDIAIDNRKEDKTPLEELEFKLSSNNDIYSKQSEYYYEQNIPTYMVFDNTILGGDNEFKKAYNVLSDNQKEVLESIKTTDDFSKLTEGKYIDCYEANPSDWTNPSVQRENGYYCSLPLPTVFLLEETKVPTGYVKDKVFLPGTIIATFYIKNYAVTSMTLSPNPNTVQYRLSDYFEDTYPVRLERLEITTTYQPYHLPYGKVEKKSLLGTNIDEVWEIWKKNAEVGSFCNPPSYDNAIYESFWSIMTPTQMNAVGTGTETYNDKVCGAVFLVSKEGKVNLEVTTSVNNEETLTAGVETNLQYKGKVKNIGTVVAIDNVITSKLPEGFIYVKGSASNGGEYKDGVIQWRLSRINIGEETELSYQFYAPKGVNLGEEYISEASVTSFAMDQKVNSNKTIVKLSLVNPETIAPIGMIGMIIILLFIVGMITLRNSKKQSE